MMTTAEALEAMTDEGKFELLATSVLRKANKDYATIIHTGINAEGKTIKSSLDGFCQVPHSDHPLFLLVQHSTTGIKNLAKKWLYDHKISKGKNAKPSSDGDLIKAAHEADEIRKHFSNAEFCVILTTNHHLDLNSDFIKDIYKKAKELSVRVEIWEQSRFSDFLDNTPDGHWLRKQYLGIDAELLSADLLRDISQQSMEMYMNEVSRITNPRMWILREIDKTIETASFNANYRIHFLVGGSGHGKSISAYQFLKKHLNSGGYGIWLNAELIKACTHIESAIDTTLRDLHPKLEMDAGRLALQIVQEEGKRLLLVIDDANRIDQPVIFIENLIKWSKPMELGSNSPSSPSPYFIICPIWLIFGYSINSSSDNNSSWLNIILLDTMNSDEGAKAIQKAVGSKIGMELTTLEAKDLAERLRNDPVLLGLFACLLTEDNQNNMKMLADKALDNFIQTSINESNQTSRENYFEVEYLDSLSKLTQIMLKQRKLYPLWSDIVDWFANQPNDLKRLRILINHGAMCTNDRDKLIFRHDRIRDYLFVNNIKKMLIDGPLDTDILSEPFYAEIIGQSIAEVICDHNTLVKARELSPLSLFIALKHFNEKPDYQKAIVCEIG